MAGISILSISIASVAISAVILTGSSDLSDRLVEVGDVFAGATLLLTIVAAVVALLAYASATGSPDLRMQLDFPFSQLNNPVFQSTFNDNGVATAVEFKQLNLTLRVRNDSSYSAKNPAVVIRLHDMAFSPDEKNNEWTTVQFASTHGITVVQWDGGSNYSIHGSSVRTLPGLWLERLHTVPNPDPYLLIDILADGYSRQDIKIPVRFVSELPSYPAKYEDSGDQWI